MLQHFAYAMAALLVCHMPKFVAVTIADLDKKKINAVMNLKCDGENIGETGPCSRYVCLVADGWDCLGATRDALWKYMNIWNPFYCHWLMLILTWISNHVHYKLWDKITYPIPNFNGAAIEIWD